MHAMTTATTRTTMRTTKRVPKARLHTNGAVVGVGPTSAALLTFADRPLSVC